MLVIVVKKCNPMSTMKIKSHIKGDQKMKTIVNYNSIKDMEVEIKNPLSDALVHVVGAFMQGFADAWVKYATKNAIVSDECLISSIGASNVREALKIGLLERIIDRGYEKGSEVYNLTVDQLDSDMGWHMSVLKARGYNHDEAFKKTMKSFHPDYKFA